MNYRAYGLALRSDVALPARPSSESDADLVLTLEAPGSIPATAPEGRRLAGATFANGQGSACVETEAGYLIRYFNIADFLVSKDLRAVRLRAASEEAVPLAAMLFTGGVLAFILSLHGCTVLHASAVELGGRAIAIAGAGGQGKSTLAALLCSRGGLLVSDDVLRIESAAGDSGIDCAPGLLELRLRQTSAALADAFPGTCQRVTADQRVSVRPPATMASRLPLRAALIPVPDRSAARLECLRLPASDALMALASYPRVLGWAGPQVLRRDFLLLGKLVQRVPVARVKVPWGPPFAPALGQEILELANSL